MFRLSIKFACLAAAVVSLVSVGVGASKECKLSPLGEGQDDTDQVEAAIAECGIGGTTKFASGNYNITRKMTWNLVDSTVNLHGYLSFKPDIPYWLNASNTYRVVFIQNQASWFVVTGSNFVIDAHNEGGINGNGQPWWSYYGNNTVHKRADGDGRPLSLTLHNVTHAKVNRFRIISPPFWCNTVAESQDVVYDGMYCNATNEDSVYAGQNIVPNTDGINTYRSDRITLLNWDITCGDDCLAIKGNSTNIIAKDITCRGGNGIAYGSLGQYQNLSDIVDNVEMQNIKFIRLPAAVQPNMVSGIYLKSWTGTSSGSPPTSGGGGTGYVSNVYVKNVEIDRLSGPVIHLYQTNGGHTGDTPSSLQFSNLTFEDFTGTAKTNKVVDMECSANAPCPNLKFKNINVTLASGLSPRYICVNVLSESGLSAPCNATGQA